MHSIPLVDNIVTSINNLRRRSSLRDTLRSFGSTSSLATSLRSKKSRRSSYYPYAIYEQTMFPIILRDPEATRKVLEAILDSPNGKRSLSRLARTCRALSEPALDSLWRELDSIVPILGLFPNNVLKKAKRPGLGLAKVPQEADWDIIMKYNERIHRIAYDETANNVAASVFPIIDEHRPCLYILPHLRELVWKAETPAGLDRCAMFLTPELRSIHFEIGASFKHSQISAFLADMSSRTLLTSFSFNSPTSLPDSFTELLLRQESLERVVLVAPGALSPGVGRWIGGLPTLKSLQLDLTGRSPIAVEGFFDEVFPRSGCSTPSSIGSTDSGVFSGEELDFAELRKSALRLTEDSPTKGSFSQLRRVHLTGEVANITVFLKHLSSAITHLDLVIEDPPDNADWQDLSHLICEAFGDSLQSLRISATGSSRFADLVRSTSRAEPPSNRLSLQHLTDLIQLTRLEIDLPESIIFLPSDLQSLAQACPRLEILRLCPLSRFSPNSGGPRLTLESVSLLTKRCKHLHTIGAVVNALEADPTTLQTQAFSSRSLLRVHLGHSWIADPLQVAILLSHLAPRLEYLRWFQERNRPGFIEANAKNWQTVSDTLPHLQRIRKIERSFAQIPESILPKTVDKAIDATPSLVSRAVFAAGPEKISFGAQCTPVLVDQAVYAVQRSISISVDATPSTFEAAVEAKPAMVSTEIDATPPSEPQSAEAMPRSMKQNLVLTSQVLRQLYLIPSILGLFSFFYKYFIAYPLAIPTRVGLQLLTFTRTPFAKRETSFPLVPKQNPPSSTSATLSAIPLDTLQDCDSPYAYAQRNHAYAYAYAYEIYANLPSSSPNAIPEDDLKDELPEVSIGTWLSQGSLQIANNNAETRHREWIERVQKSSSWASIMADNKKQEKDYTLEVDALLPEAEAVVKSGKLQDALDKILSLEKLTRNAADLSSTTRLAKAAIQHCYDARDYPLLNSTISLLSKKHGQLKAVIQAFVEQTINWLPEIKQRDGEERWLELLETLRTVTEGKIFLETPRARVTLLLAHYHEGVSQSTKAKDPKESMQTASDLLSDLQVETYSSMERREKTEFILEQMRLLIKVARQKDNDKGKKDSKDSLGGGEAEWVKVRVGGRKVNEEFLKEKDNQDLKLKYYEMMIQHALHQDAYLDVAKYYYKVWETPSIKEDVADKGRAALEHIVYYIVLAPHNNEQSDMLHHLFVDPALTKLELQYNLVKSFTTQELMRWPGIEAIYGKFLRKTPVFSLEKRWEDLHTRVIEHNIRVVAAYYTRITLTRLASLLDLTTKQTEEILSRLVVSGTIWARVDRPTGIINFRSPRSTEDVMNDWSSDMQKLLALVEKTWMGMNAAQAAQSRVKS